jgi:hypothetical protein
MIIISMSILGMMFKLEFELGLGLGFNHNPNPNSNPLQNPRLINDNLKHHP